MYATGKVRLRAARIAERVRAFPRRGESATIIFAGIFFPDREACLSGRYEAVLRPRERLAQKNAR
jgi:hypothetical protein